MIPQQLIENALALCDKEIESMVESKNIDYFDESLKHEFSIEKFCFFLLSDKFLIAYNHKMIDTRQEQHWGNDIWWYIAEYQVGNEKPLQDLLAKIN